MKTIIFSLFFISVVFSYAYNIQSTSECLAYDPTHGVCSKWSQNGTISQDSSCFVGQTIVKQMKKGFIQMKDLQVGDKILTLKRGQSKWSQVEGWLHKSETTQGVYRKISLEINDQIIVSGKHNIAFYNQQSSYQYTFPADDNKQKQLYPSSQKIIKNEIFITQGKYAPLTSQSSYFVYSSKNLTPVLAHDYANLRNPEMYEPIAKMILGVSKLYKGEHTLNKQGVHTAAEWMMNNFSFLME